MLSELLTRVAPGENAIADLCRELGATATIRCTVLPGDTTPGVIFPAAVVRWAGERGVSIGLDVIAGSTSDD